MQPEAFGQGVSVQRTVGEFAKQAEFDCAKQRLGAPETEANLHNDVGIRNTVHQLASCLI